MISERELQISPLVPDSIIHNTKTLSTLHNITASLFGVGAGILGLEAYSGFLFYLIFSLVTSLLVYVSHIRPAAGEEGTAVFFRGSLEFWGGGLMEGMAGFVLTWTLFYGLVRA